MNRFEIDYAAPGFCSLCHDEIAEFDGFVKVGDTFKPRVTKLKGNFRMTAVQLSDNSMMNVSLCDKCVDLKPEDCEKIMVSEIKGWHKEIEHFGLGDNAKSWATHYASKLSIEDVPSMGWNEEQKSILKSSKELSNGNDIKG